MRERNHDDYKKEKAKNGHPFWHFFKRFILISFLFVVAIITTAVIYYFSTLYTPGEEQEGYLALTNGTVLLGEELESVEGLTVLIHDGIISHIGATLDLPESATVMDLDGQTLMPGLIDLHVHLGMPEIELGQEPSPLEMVSLISDFFSVCPR